jgi:hypothetical protein
MLNVFFKRQASSSFTETTLFDQTNFYLAFEKDLGNCQYETIIESPFITRPRGSGVNKAGGKNEVKSKQQ